MFTKKEKTGFSFMAAVFLLLLFLLKIFVFSDRTQKMGKESASLYFNITQKDPDNIWQSVIPNHPLMHGTVYQSKIINHSRHSVSNWKMVLKITKPVYLTNCWNGSVEIHQTTKGKKLIQKAFKLQNKDYNELKELKVNKFCGKNKPLLIYLNPGDKIIYYPDTLYSENVIPGYNTDDFHYSEIGFIFHKADSEPLNLDFDFANAYITYHMEDSMGENFMLYTIGFLFLLWSFIFFYQVRVNIIKIRKLKEREHNKIIIEQVMSVFTKFIDAKDIFIGSHSERVAIYSRMIAKESGRNDDVCQKVFYCGLLHDCGKISVKDDILKKTEPLTEDEFKTLRSHTKKGYELLKCLSSIPEACQTALLHHERFDGTGFPEHLSGTLIPEAARIVAVADCYDTMHSDSYIRKSISAEKIIEELKERKSTQFDPEFVDALINLVKKGRI